jgi:hypothetical protein
MKRRLLLLVPAIVALSGCQRSIHFTATIESVEVLQKDYQSDDGRLTETTILYDGPIHLVDGVLSNWAIRMHVESVAVKNPCLAPGDTVVFGVHSPSDLLGMGGEEAIGKQFQFVALCDTSADAKMTSIGLEPFGKHRPRGR